MPRAKKAEKRARQRVSASSEEVEQLCQLLENNVLGEGEGGTLERLRKCLEGTRSDELLGVIQSSNTIQKVAAFLTNDSLAVRISAVDVLAVLARNEDCKQAINTSGVVELMFEMLRSLTTGEGVVHLSQTQPLVRRLLDFTSDLFSFNTDAVTKLHKSGGLDVLVAMLDLESEPVVRADAVTALANLAGMDERLDKLILREAAGKVCMLTKASPQIEVAAARALSALSASPSRDVRQAMILQPIMIPTMVALLQSTTSEEAARQHALYALCELCLVDPELFGGLFRQSGGLAPLVAVLKEGRGGMVALVKALLLVMPPQLSLLLGEEALQEAAKPPVQYDRGAFNAAIRVARKAAARADKAALAALLASLLPAMPLLFTLDEVLMLQDVLTLAKQALPAEQQKLILQAGVAAQQAGVGLVERLLPLLSAAEPEWRRNALLVLASMIRLRPEDVPDDFSTCNPFPKAAELVQRISDPTIAENFKIALLSFFGVFLSRHPGSDTAAATGGPEGAAMGGDEPEEVLDAGSRPLVFNALAGALQQPAGDAGGISPEVAKHVWHYLSKVTLWNTGANRILDNFRLLDTLLDRLVAVLRSGLENMSAPMGDEVPDRTLAWACEFLVNLAYYDGINTVAKKLLRSGSMQLLVMLLQHPGVDVRKAVVAALASITDSEDRDKAQAQEVNRQLVTNADLVNNLLRILQLQDSDDELKKTVCKVLDNLAKTCQDEASKGFHGLVLEPLLYHYKTTASLQVKQHCASTLKNLADCCKPVKEKILAANCPEILQKNPSRAVTAGRQALPAQASEGDMRPEVQAPSAGRRGRRAAAAAAASTGGSSSSSAQQGLTGMVPTPPAPGGPLPAVSGAAASQQLAHHTMHALPAAPPHMAAGSGQLMPAPPLALSLPASTSDEILERQQRHLEALKTLQQLVSQNIERTSSFAAPPPQSAQLPPIAPLMEEAPVSTVTMTIQHHGYDMRMYEHQMVIPQPPSEVRPMLPEDTLASDTGDAMASLGALVADVPSPAVVEEAPHQQAPPAHLQNPPPHLQPTPPHLQPVPPHLQTPPPHLQTSASHMPPAASHLQVPPPHQLQSPLQFLQQQQQQQQYLQQPQPHPSQASHQHFLPPHLQTQQPYPPQAPHLPSTLLEPPAPLVLPPLDAHTPTVPAPAAHTLAASTPTAAHAAAGAAHTPAAAAHPAPAQLQTEHVDAGELEGASDEGEQHGIGSPHHADAANGTKRRAAGGSAEPSPRKSARIAGKRHATTPLEGPGSSP